MDPQSRVTPPVEHASNANAVGSSSQTLVADTEHDPLPECTICCCEFKNTADGGEPIAVQVCDCGYLYCARCLEDMFVAAIKDPSRMPPECCVQIHPIHVRPYLPPAEYTEYKHKYEEWSTTKPLYCPLPTCSAFIPNRLFLQALTAQGQQLVGSMTRTPQPAEISCPQCTTDICTKCRQLAHPNQMCENLDFGVDKDTAKLLKKLGYKRCPRCQSGVKKMFGCRHMQCVCGAHWCWVCQRPYDECNGEGDCKEEVDDYYHEFDGERNEEGDYYSVDEEDEEEGQAAQNPGLEKAEACATAIDAVAQPAPRVRNLDAFGRGHWEDNNADFGDEPEDEFTTDRYWDCDHHFETARFDFTNWLSGGPSTTNIECLKCWTDVPLNLAYDCRGCGLVVCNSCKDIALAE